jgi:hypothetical protein
MFEKSRDLLFRRGAEGFHVLRCAISSNKISGALARPKVKPSRLHFRVNFRAFLNELGGFFFQSLFQRFVLEDPLRRWTQ